MVSNHPQPEAAAGKLINPGEFNVSQFAMSKLDAFRYQPKPSDDCQLASSHNARHSPLMGLIELADEPTDPVLTTEPVTGVVSGSVAFSDGIVPKGRYQTSPARAVDWKKSFDPSAEAKVDDISNQSEQFTSGRGSIIGLETTKGCSSGGDSNIHVHGPAVASDETSSRQVLTLERCGDVIALEPVNDQLDSSIVEVGIEQTYGQHILTPTNFQRDLRGLRDGTAEATNLIDGTVSLQVQDRSAQYVPCLVPQPVKEIEWYDPEDDFLLDDDDMHDLMDLSAAQEVVELSSSLQLSSSQNIQAKTRELPMDTYNRKIGADVTIEATIGALDSASSAVQFAGHIRANIGRKLTTTDPLAKKPSSSNDEEYFDLDDEGETELAHITAAISQDRPATLWNAAAALPTPPAATLASASGSESTQHTSVVYLSSSPSQHPPHSPSDGRLEPFVRAPFPKRVRDRSPIVDVTSNGVLRTCFRVGEALNAASQAFRTGTDVIIELFARVTASTREREGYKQHFDFADLFHSERPPFLSGTYELWKDGGRWEEDSRRFLDESGNGKLCRAVGRLRRDRDTKTWKMAVLSVWEATWDDVAWVKGVVCA